MFEWLFGSRSEEIPNWYARDQGMRSAQTLPPARVDPFHGITSADAYIAYEKRMLLKVSELTRGFPPEYNIAPLLELVKQADWLGFDVVSRP